MTPRSTEVEVTAEELAVRFGPWSVRTHRSNIVSATVEGPYKWYRAIGTRLSLSDRGLTFGTDTASGVCIVFHEEIGGIDPLHKLRHPNLTVTVDEPRRLALLLNER